MERYGFFVALPAGTRGVPYAKSFLEIVPIPRKCVFGTLAWRFEVEE
jgi:hypothetical protein